MSSHHRTSPRTAEKSLIPRYNKTQLAARKRSVSLKFTKLDLDQLLELVRQVDSVRSQAKTARRADTQAVASRVRTLMDEMVVLVDLQTSQKSNRTITQSSRTPEPNGGLLSIETIKTIQKLTALDQFNQHRRPWVFKSRTSVPSVLPTPCITLHLENKECNANK